MNRKLLNSSLLFFFEFWSRIWRLEPWKGAACCCWCSSLSHGCHPTGCHRSSAIKRASWRPHWHPNVNRLYINRRTEWELSLEAVMRRIVREPIQIPHTFRQPKPTQDTTDRRTMRRNQLRFSISRHWKRISFYACAKTVEYSSKYIYQQQHKPTTMLHQRHLTHSNVNARHLFAAVECVCDDE